MHSKIIRISELLSETLSSQNIIYIFFKQIMISSKKTYDMLEIKAYNTNIIEPNISNICYKKY